MHTPILCIGSALWDTIGRHPGTMSAGHDRPGRIRRIPGGVALNVALALARLGERPQVLTVLGRDQEGDALMAACAALGVDLSFSLRRADLPTDAYMAIEDTGGLVAAIADAHSLEAAGSDVLAPLEDGRLGSAARPFDGTVILDGNLTEAVLQEIAASPLFAAADLRVVPASPGKALRLRPFVETSRGTLYVNREEACLLTGCDAPDAETAGQALVAAGAARAIVTDGTSPAADVCRDTAHSARPPSVTAQRVTGAGDTLLAVHTTQERRGTDRGKALTAACAAAARFVSGEDIR